MTDTAATISMSKVQQLKAKRLQNFIAKTQREIRKKMVNKSTSKRSRKAAVVQPIEYQKLNMDTLDSLLEVGIYDDKPMIFFGKDEELGSETILKNPEQINQIIRSFQNFRDIIESMVQENIENDAYRYVRHRDRI